MRLQNRLRVSTALLFITVLLPLAVAADQIRVQFLYWDPTTDQQYCSTCSSWLEAFQSYLAKNQTVTALQADYPEVSFEWIEATNVSSRNTLVINGIVKIEGNFNETYIRQTLDTMLSGKEPPAQDTLTLGPLVGAAFAFGFFETFSPCLLALLSFVLSYSVGEDNRFGKGFAQVLSFGFGFLAAALILGFTVGIMFLSLRVIQFILMWGVVIFAIIMGISLLGIFKSKVETKPIVKRLTRRYATTLAGLLLLGFLFYFLDPCIAPVFVAMLPLLSPQSLSVVLLVFSIGVIIPFIAVGLLAGSISKLVRVTYRNRSRIRAVSGIILLAYSAYLIITYLL